MKQRTVLLSIVVFLIILTLASSCGLKVPPKGVTLAPVTPDTIQELSDASISLSDIDLVISGEISLETDYFRGTQTIRKMDVANRRFEELTIPQHALVSFVNRDQGTMRDKITVQAVDAGGKVIQLPFEYNGSRYVLAASKWTEEGKEGKIRYGKYVYTFTVSEKPHLLMGVNEQLFQYLLGTEK